MQSKLSTLLWSFVACTVVFAQGVKIDEAIPFENGAKTSLAIAYTGTEKLTYFALDATEGVLTLDLPGVYSNVDFSQLQFAQVRAITQVPLNPDSSEGISISFFLREGVVYSLYEGNPGELIIFFEESAIIQPVAEVSETTTQSVASNNSAAEISGEPGSGRLAAVHVETYENVGLIQLTTASDVETRDFYLSGPRRYVLDLKETICSLDHDRIELNAPLVKQVRVRQFQVEPTAVTRLVLDLETKTEVKFRPSDSGLLLAFGPDEAMVDAILADGKLPVHQQEMVAETVAEPVAEEVSTPPKAEAETLVADESTTPAVTAPTEVEPETPIAVTEEQVATPIAEMEEKATEDASNPAPIETEEQAKEVVQEPVLEEKAELIAQEDVQPTPQETVADESTPVETKLEETPVPEEVIVKNEEPVVPAASETVVEEQVPLVQDQASLTAAPATEKTVADATAEKDSQVVAEVESNALGEENAKLYQTFQERSGTDDNTVTLTLDVPHSNDLASIDNELEDFLGEEEEKTPYNIMRHADLKRPLREGPILMNNSTVAKANQQLAEMAPLQEDEAGTDPEDLVSIFAEPEVNDDFETLSGNRKKYRGFEIDSIDVKNVQVIDLLRFLASQINVNLYIDSSVSPTLTATYKFTNMPWDLVLDMILNNANLDKEFSHGVLRVATIEKFRREAEQRRELQEQRELAVPVETVHMPLSYAKAADVEEIVRNYLSPRGLILRDDRTNTLIIEDIPKRMLSIRALIKKLDKMISQVTIEARVVETTKRFLRELGIQWGLSANYSPELGTDTGLTFPNRVGVGGPVLGTTSRFQGLQGGYAVNFPVVSENPSGIGLSFGNFLDNFKLDISLQMLEDEGGGRIISAPKITTQNNKTATIQNGSRIPIQTIQRGTLTIRYIDATLQLLVTPHITADETIIMDIVVDKSEPDFTRTVSGNPVINIRKADTRVLVKNGGTAVIGGIFTINEQSSARGIPKLRSIPFLRRVFGSERVEYTNQELLIFVTPRIVKY